MNRLALAAALAALVSGCAADSYSALDSESRGAPDVDFYTTFDPDDVIESVMIDKKVCGIHFTGIHDPAADTLAFWTVGVDAIERDIPYPTNRPNFYAVFTPSNEQLNHTVAGFEAYDHYHIADKSAIGARGDLVDAFVVNPGPNYNPSTYVVARSVSEMNAQVAAGILAAPVTTIDAGFGPIVFHGEVACGRELEEIYNDGEGCNH